MNRLPIVVLLAACAACAGASAQTLKPGLWEMQHRMQGNPQMEQAMVEMQKQMAALPPEQRKQMEAMISRQGVQMGPAPGSLRMCLTKEMVERNDIPANQGDCKTTRQQRTGNTLTMAFTCANPPSTGESQVTFAGPESYTMKTVATTTVNGKPEKVTVEGSGKWLAADCGSVRPVAPR